MHMALTSGLPRVGRIEKDFAPDGRDAEAISISADAGDDIFEQIDIARLIERTESQRVQDGDRSSAHGENVADDAADSRCRAFVWFDRARDDCAIRP